jgi:hypothetical protein
MSQIYRNTKQTIVWLGHGRPLEDAFHFLNVCQEDGALHSVVDALDSEYKTPRQELLQKQLPRRSMGVIMQILC